MLIDTVSDGVWIEVDGRRWDIRYDGDLAGGGDTWEQVERRFELSDPLRRCMWCRSTCEKHLSLCGLMTDYVEVPEFLPSWLHRDLKTGDLIYRIQCCEPAAYRAESGVWDWFRWRFSRLFGNRLTFNEIMKVAKTQLQNEATIAFDPDHLYPRASYMRWFASDAPQGWNNRAYWVEPIPIDSGLFIPRRYEFRAEDGTNLYATTLLLEESFVGDGVALSNRAVDQRKPAVAWN